MPDTTFSSGTVITSDWLNEVNIAKEAVVNVKDPRYGATGDGVADDTTAIQAAIDESYDQGGGEVVLPPGVYSLGASTYTDVFENANGTKVANTGCLILWSGVFLVGSGVNETILKPTSGNLTCILHVSPTSGGVRNLQIDSQWDASKTSETQGHGLFSLVKESPTDADRVFKNVAYRDLIIKNQAAYGIGIQGYADLQNVILDNIHVENTGLDNIDTKYRGPNKQHEGCSMNNLRLHSPGMRLASQCALDIRGPWQLTNIFITDIGASAYSTTDGFRFRTYEDAAPNSNPVGLQAEYATLTNFRVNNTQSNCTTRGVFVGSADVKISNGSVTGCTENYSVAGNSDGSPDRVKFVNCGSFDGDTYGFYVGGVCKNTSLVNCSDSGSATAGFRNEGDSTVMVACYTNGTTTPLSQSIGSANSSCIIACPFDGGSYLGVNPQSGYVDLSAKGSATDMDLRLLPKGAGNIRFGTRTASADAPVTGYIEIKDAGGTVRRLAVIG